MKSRSIKDFTGHKYGFIEVLRKVSGSTASDTLWEARCACGTTFEVKHKVLTSNKKKTCGCAIKTTKFSPGNKYGRLTIVREGKRLLTKNRNIRILLCRCDCGNRTLVPVRDYNLTSGNTTSCGCYGMESRVTHGKSDSRTYRIWEGMKRRCRPDLAEDFPYHAGKGITYDPRWEIFENFLDDMGEAPEGLTLDRINPNGNYQKDNCRWADNSLQGYNKGFDPNNTSGKTGVSFYTNQKKWSAEIHVKGEHIRLGMFDDFNDAVKARKDAEMKYYGFFKPEVVNG